MKQYALVTGGGRGIGRAVSLKLAEAGFYVLVNFQRNQTEADKTVAQIKENGGEAETLQFDISDKADIEKKLGGWVAANKDKIIQVLVNNAGILKDNLML